MKSTTLRSVFVAMFAALISIGCFIAVPLGPGGIPIVLQNMMVILSACLLGNIQGAASVGLFLAAGALGLPVYAGGTGGFGHLVGPTGGFLIGYFFGALAAGLIAGTPKANEKSIQQLLRLLLAAVSGYVIIYIPGILQFMHLKQTSFALTVAGCVIPFLPGDLIKLCITVPLAAKLRPVIAQYLYSESEEL